MNYIGSKKALSRWLLNTIIAETEDMPEKGMIFCDLFAGTGIVGTTFRPFSKTVISNDLEYYSYILNRNYIGNSDPKILEDKKIFDMVSEAKPTEGFIFHHYCEGGDAGRLYFSKTNGKKIDGMRIKIEELKKEISEDMYFFLLASLIESADKVANTASVYGAFLKKLKRAAQQDIVLSPALFLPDEQKNQIYNLDANELITKIKGDVLYLDPPYNQRQYSANYHLLNTIAKYEEFEPKGKTGLPNYNKSDFSKKSEVKKAFEDLISRADFKYIFLSYNNEGLLSETELLEILGRHGEVSLFKKEYRRFKADTDQNRDHKASSTYEYLYKLKKEIKQ